MAVKEKGSSDKLWEYHFAEEPIKTKKGPRLIRSGKWWASPGQVERWGEDGPRAAPSKSLSFSYFQRLQGIDQDSDELWFKSLLSIWGCLQSFQGTMVRPLPHTCNKKLSGPKCQQCWSWETLINFIRLQWRLNEIILLKFWHISNIKYNLVTIIISTCKKILYRQPVSIKINNKNLFMSAA